MDPTERIERISRHLNKICRHTALDCGLPVRPDGYIPVPPILELPFYVFHKVTEGDILTVIESNEKRRFEWRKNKDGWWHIRSVQGHSLPIAEAKLLKMSGFLENGV